MPTKSPYSWSEDFDASCERAEIAEAVPTVRDPVNMNPMNPALTLPAGR
jgi:hypothetical protein